MDDNTATVLSTLIGAIVSGLFGWITKGKVQRRKINRAVERMKSKHPDTINEAVAEMVKKELTK